MSAQYAQRADVRTNERSPGASWPVLAEGRRPLILHISGDYPDPVRNRTTFAVKNFIDLVNDCDHVIVSLKRRSSQAQCYFRECAAPAGQRLFALGYRALPGGLLHRIAMKRLAFQIRDIVTRLGVEPDLVMAHKLTIEGVAANMLWRMTGIPYVCCVRGEVENKFFRVKPGLFPLFADVIAHAEALLYVSAWFRKRIERRYPGLAKRQMLLPNFVMRPITAIATSAEPHAVVSVFDLDMYRRKGFHHLIRALAEARKRVPDLRLDIIGWSSPATSMRLRRMVERAGLSPAVRFLGEMSHDEVLHELPRYCALVLPARNETFGMVYAEALLSHVPILYAADSGIDGYLDGLDVGVRVGAGDVAAIAEGLCRLAKDGQKYRDAIVRDNERIRALFAPDRYLGDFRTLLAEIRQQAATERRVSR